ncbi:calcium/sodium antiporter [bacterium]|nr:calcium/sodium antiporter [bacterium]
MTFLYISEILISLALLWKGSDWLVERAVRIADWMGVSQLVIGLTIVAFGTSAPEFAVTVGAALSGQANISISNVIGSNIYNLGFIMGSVAMIRAVGADRKLIFRDGSILIICSLSLLLFLFDLHLSRIEGFILFIGLLVYNYFLIHRKEKVEIKTEKSDNIVMDWLMLILGLILVILGGTLLRMGAVGVARKIGISDWVIGVTLIAGGTSAPEFATSLMASYRGHHGISAGNLIGSCIFNIMGVLGVAGLLRPMSVSQDARSNTLMMFGILVISLIFFRTGWKMSRAEGVILVILSIIFWIIIL